MYSASFQGDNPVPSWYSRFRFLLARRRFTPLSLPEFPKAGSTVCPSCLEHSSWQEKFPPGQPVFSLCHYWPILFPFCQQIPDDPCRFIGQGNRRYLSAASRCHSLNPFLHGIAFVLPGQGIASNYPCSLD